MLCCISGVVPQDPVISRTNGCLYERRLIEKYIEQNGRCPRTGEPMVKEDLLTVSSGGASTHRTISATSIPGLLELLHAEWDALMIEQFNLRQQLSQAQQELSHALYQHDAACRVIAKMVKERDALKQQLRGQQQSGAAAPAEEEEDEEEAAPVLPPHVVQEIDSQAQMLKASRKQREEPPGLATPRDLGDFVEILSYHPHSDVSGTVGVHCVDTVDRANGQVLFSGGQDSKAICYDVARRATCGTLIGHTKPVRGLTAFGNVVVTWSDDATSRVWEADGGSFKTVCVVKGHQGAVTGAAVLPARRHFLTCAADGQLLFNDLATGVSIACGKTHETQIGLSCCALHPDGFVAATGCGNRVLLWDVKQMEVEISLPHDQLGTVTSIAFCEDGRTMAGSTSQGVIKLWDLRNTDQPVDNITFEDSTPSKPIPISRVVFDDFGRYLAVAANAVKIWHPKERRLVTSLTSHVGPVTDVAWGTDAKNLVSSSLDRTVKYYTLPRF